MAAQSPASPTYAIVESGSEHSSAIARLTLQAGMGALSDRGVSFVAVEDGASDAAKGEGGEGESAGVLGFVRIVRSAGRDYICPIVVDASAQGGGVGQALMTFAHERFGTLRFVARGEAVPFYESLGCRETSWSDIALDISSDCVDCPDRAGCAPQPMVWD